MARLRLVATLLAFVLTLRTALAQKSQTPDLGLSACATQCVLGNVQFSGCVPTDTTCLCASQKYSDAVQLCLQDCTIRETIAAVKFQKTTCKAPVRDRTAITRNVAWALYGIACATVLGRFLFRSTGFNGSGYGPDDLMVLLGLILVTPLNAMIDIMTHHGLGRDIWMVDPDDVTLNLRYFWSGEFCYILVLSTTKMAVVLLYLRIWQKPDTGQSKFRIACFVLLALLVVSSLVLCLCLAFECWPISHSWLYWDGEHKGRCTNLQAQVFAMAGTNIGLDILVYILPITMILRIRTMSLRKKIGVGLMFSVGLFVTICSIVRLRYLVEWGDTTNPTWHNHYPAIWSMVETNLSVVCACLPSMAGLFQRVWNVANGGSWGTYATGNLSTGWRSRSGRNRDSGVQLRDIPSPSAILDERSEYGTYRVVSADWPGSPTKVYDPDKKVQIF